MKMDELVFLDTETTGLDPLRHEVWDIGLIRGDTGEEIEYHIKPTLVSADPTALRLTDYYNRIRGPHWSWMIHSAVAERIATLTAGKHIVGAVPSFDAAFLDVFLRANGQAPAWHYHLIDVETMIAGRLQLEPPLNSDELSLAIGVDPAAYDRHTALGDARWVKAQYEAVMRHGKA